MNEIICPRCGHDHGAGWESPVGSCHHGATWESVPPLQRMVSKPCRCIVTYPTALLNTTYRELARAVYVLAAVHEMYSDMSVVAGRVLKRADALQANEEERR